jgi:Helix-turn-helix domain
VERDTLPITEAAPLLGLSVAAARKKVQRGQLPAIKRGGLWYVLIAEAQTSDSRLRTVPALSQGHPRTTKRRPRTAETKSPTDETNSPTSQAALLSQVAAERDRLSAIVNTLTVQLTAKDRQIGELHVLLQQAQHALPDVRPTEAPAVRASPWWAFWRRG